MPLVRYHIADKGGVLSYDEMWIFLNVQGIHSVSELGLNKDFEPRNLPFVLLPHLECVPNANNMT